MKTYNIVDIRTGKIWMIVEAKNAWDALIAADHAGFNINKVDAIEV